MAPDPLCHHVGYQVHAFKVIPKRLPKQPKLTVARTLFQKKQKGQGLFLEGDPKVTNFINAMRESDVGEFLRECPNHTEKNVLGKRKCMSKERN